MSKPDAVNRRLNAFIDRNSGLYGTPTPYLDRTEEYIPPVIKEREFWEFEVTIYRGKDRTDIIENVKFTVPKCKLNKGDHVNCRKLLEDRFNGKGGGFTARPTNGFLSD